MEGYISSKESLSSGLVGQGIDLKTRSAVSMTIGHEMCLLLIEMQYIHQSCRFNDFRKIAVNRETLSSPTTVHSGTDLKGNDYWEKW
jgi:hypothetical protein